MTTAVVTLTILVVLLAAVAGVQTWRLGQASLTIAELKDALAFWRRGGDRVSRHHVRRAMGYED